jgi:hypothetical protein
MSLQTYSLNVTSKQLLYKLNKFIYWLSLVIFHPQVLQCGYSIQNSQIFIGNSWYWRFSHPLKCFKLPVLTIQRSAFSIYSVIFLGKEIETLRNLKPLCIRGLGPFWRNSNAQRGDFLNGDIIQRRILPYILLPKILKIRPNMLPTFEHEELSS